MTQSQQYTAPALIEQIAEALRALPRARAALVRGTPYSGQPESATDIELLVVAADAPAEELLELGRAALASAAPALWVSLISPIPPRLRALLNGPHRIDLAVVTAEALPSSEGWRVLFDHDALLSARGRGGAGDDLLQPEHIVIACDEFWWGLYSSIGQLKHGQLWQALHLLGKSRDVLAQVMRWRRDMASPFEQYGDLEQHLTAEDQQALAQTLADYDLRAVAAALLSAADAFDPAAREVAASLGAIYPTALAQATKAYFIREFWPLIAPGPAISA